MNCRGSPSAPFGGRVVTRRQERQGLTQRGLDLGQAFRLQQRRHLEESMRKSPPKRTVWTWKRSVRRTKKRKNKKEHGRLHVSSSTSQGQLIQSPSISPTRWASRPAGGKNQDLNISHPQGPRACPPCTCTRASVDPNDK